MFGDNSYIVNLIEARKETDCVDYKEKYYSDDKKYDLIKDVVAFANNCTSSKDKFIVFGVVNGTWETKGIQIDHFPDSSDVAVLLHTYVEPFLTIETGTLKYNNVDLGYIKIPSQGINRPYVIKKQYEKVGKIYLRCGEIYVRKGTSNFIANRMELDQIYRSNGCLKIALHSNDLEIGEVQIGKASVTMVQMRLILSNTFGYSINICNMKCDLVCASSNVELTGVFFEDMAKRFASNPMRIDESPILLDAGAERQKSLYAIISEDYASVIQDYVKAQKHFKVQITCIDVSGRLFTSDEVPVEIKLYGNLAG